MQYHHIFHAGNFADVFKHVVLVALFDSLAKKDKPILFLDTHAGIGIYDLKDPQARRTREYEEGIYRLWRSVNSSAPDAIKHYLEIVRACNIGVLVEEELPTVELLPTKKIVTDDITKSAFAPMPRYYPGSPLLVASLLRSQDRMVLTELHPQDARMLKRIFQEGWINRERRLGQELAQRARTQQPSADPTTELGPNHQIAIHNADGYQAIKAFLPPKTGRALTLMDPAFEDPDEFDKMLIALELAFQRYPIGTYTIWYPIKDDILLSRFLRALHQIGFADILVREFGVPRVDPTNKKLQRTGIAIINPPFKFEKTLLGILSYLQGALFC